MNRLIVHENGPKSSTSQALPLRFAQSMQPFKCAWKNGTLLYNSHKL